MNINEKFFADPHFLEDVKEGYELGMRRENIRKRLRRRVIGITATPETLVLAWNSQGQYWYSPSCEKQRISVLNALHFAPTLVETINQFGIPTYFYLPIAVTCSAEGCSYEDPFTTLNEFAYNTDNFFDEFAKASGRDLADFVGEELQVCVEFLDEFEGISVDFHVGVEPIGSALYVREESRRAFMKERADVERGSR